MLREGAPIGVIAVTRKEARPFTQKQIELATTFADQAVIAIENVRLLTETREALQRQTATAEVLQVINSSPGDLAPVFKMILEKAHSLCAVAHGALLLYDGEKFYAVAVHGLSTVLAERLRQGYVPGPNHPSRRLLEGERFAHVQDWAKIDDPIAHVAIRAGVRTTLFIPLRGQGKLLGQIGASRLEVKPFTEKEIALLENFATQAVIAMENARLITETREALERQTATAEILQVINSSPGNLAPVFKAMLERATLLCGAGFGTLWIYDGERFTVAATHAVPAALAEFVREPVLLAASASLLEIVRGQNLVHIPDLAATELYHAGNRVRRAYVDLGGARTLISAALRKDNALLGAFNVYRQEVRPFSEKEIALVQNFAAQAVIAMENARLLDEIRHRNDELAEALEFQTATGAVLRIVASSPEDLQPVFDAMLEKAVALCEAKFGSLFLYDGKGFTVAADRNLPPAFAQAVRGRSFSAEINTGFRRLVESKAPVHIADMFADASYSTGEPLRKAAVELGGVRSFVAVPLLKKGELIGDFSIYRDEPGGFAENQIALVTTFADQAVIAIENARLLRELRQRTADLSEALQFQTASAEVLKVISRSPDALQPVFDVIVETSRELCRAQASTIFTLHDGRFYVAAFAGVQTEVLQHMKDHPIPIEQKGSALARSAREKRTVHIPNTAEDPESADGSIIGMGEPRSTLTVPLMRDGDVIGGITLRQSNLTPFTARQIEAIETFADQAVIAIANVGLFEQVQQRTNDLSESLQQQTATADVLKIISRSSVDLKTVLDTLAEMVARLCRADQTAMYRRRDDKHHLVAAWGMSEEARQFALAHPLSPGGATLTGRVILERRAVHMPDVFQDPEYTYSGGQKAIGYRTLLGIPLLREDALLGIFTITRTRVEPFTDKEIELATSFADQAVIAIENARLFEELRDRQAELRVTFDNMGDGVVMFDAEARLAAWNRNIQEMLELPDAFLARRPGYAKYFRYLADRGEYSADLEADLCRLNEDPRQVLRLERTRPDGRVVEVRRNPVPGGGFVLIYSDITQRKRAEEAVGAARDAAEAALRELQTAQASLVHAQKMAALGQLTAGIAHEIKNPLNFVNNFAALSSELTDELSDVLKPVALPGKVREEVKELTGTLKDNLGRVVQHGKRADSIVKNMLLHSREGSGEHRPVEINAIIDESLNLAYHGARAEKQGFNITLERDFDPAVGVADIYPQEITRVLLNLISNGFYAATQRAGAAGDGFEPTLRAVTRNVGDSVEIRIRDNGTGIPPDIQEKIFNPFFTTKPAGEGTGLGLSMSHDIVVKQHGGTIEVVTEPGSFTEFIITLPRVMPA
jgi:GAF domain-containing protein